MRQAGSYVGPDKLRFDFTHGERLGPDELRDVENLVNTWIADSHSVRAIETTRQEAEALGAMALFGEKYGDWVRMVEVEDVSRELCGGTHTATTAEVGIFEVTTETSSASNVRRIEALTGPAGAELFEERSGRLEEIAAMLRVPEHEVVRAVERLVKQAKQQQKQPKQELDRERADELVASADERGGIRVVVDQVDAPGPKEMLALSDAVRQRLGDAAVVLGTAVDGKGHLVANFAEKAVQQGLKAGAVIRTAAQAGEAAAAGATRWPRPAVSIPASCPRRWRPRALRSRAR